jgi:hypothetical protein
MEERQRRSFTDDYKRQAVDLVASSGRSIGSVAKELGLRDSVLSAEHGLPFQEGLPLAREPALHVLAATPDLLHSLLHGRFGFGGLFRLVPHFVILPTCYASPILFPPSTGLLLAIAFAPLSAATHERAWGFQSPAPRPKRI